MLEEVVVVVVVVVVFVSAFVFVVVVVVIFVVVVVVVFVVVALITSSSFLLLSFLFLLCPGHQALKNRTIATEADKTALQAEIRNIGEDVVKMDKKATQLLREKHEMWQCISVSFLLK